MEWQLVIENTSNQILTTPVKTITLKKRRLEHSDAIPRITKYTFGSTTIYLCPSGLMFWERSNWSKKHTSVVSCKGNFTLERAANTGTKQPKQGAYQKISKYTHHVTLMPKCRVTFACAERDWFSRVLLPELEPLILGFLCSDELENYMVCKHWCNILGQQVRIRGYFTPRRNGIEGIVVPQLLQLEGWSNDFREDYAEEQ